MTQQHYRMTLAEAIAHYQKGWITATALLYYYLKIRLAPGWKCTLHQREISQHLGIPKTSFYRALENLSAEGMIDWEAPNGLVVSIPQTELSPTNGTAVPQMELKSHQWNSSPIRGTGSPTNGTDTPSKTAPEKASSGPPDSYQIFIKSLSDYAREKFLSFVREKTANFPQPINDVEAWLAGTNGAGKERFRVYYAMFQAEVQEAMPPSQGWESHPKWPDALAAMQRGVPRFLVLGQPGCEDMDKSTRQAMVDYAEANNLIWGEKS